MRAGICLAVRNPAAGTVRNSRRVHVQGAGGSIRGSRVDRISGKSEAAAYFTGVWKRAAASAARVWTRFFHEREVILRSGGRVRFARLGPWLQFNMLLGLVAGAAWLAVATLMAAREPVQGAPDAPAAAATQSPWEARLAAAEDAAGDLSAKVARLNDALTRELRSRQVIALSRDALGERLLRLSSELRALQDRNATLQVELDATRDGMRQAADASENLQHDKEKLADRLEAARDSLESLRQRQEETALRVAGLIGRLGIMQAAAGQESDTAIAAPPEDLDAQIAMLEASSAHIIRTVEQSRKAAASAENAVNRISKGLAAIVGYPDGGKPARATPGRALAMMEKIETLHATQLEQVARLDAITTGNIERVETLVADAGLDLDEMMGRISGLGDGAGGPLLHLEDTFGGGGSAELFTNLALLQDKVNRWVELQQLLACMPLAPPLDYYRLTSPYGARVDPITGDKAIHEGIDLGGWIGMTVHATAAGTVTHAGSSGSYGKMVEIDHGCGIVTRYGHLRRVLVEKGDEVPFRAEIGKLGNSGRSTGPHVHYEVHVNGEVLDPEKFIERGRYVLKE